MEKYFPGESKDLLEYVSSELGRYPYFISVICQIIKSSETMSIQRVENILKSKPKDIILKNANWNNQFKSIEGFLMEFRINQSGLTMEMTAKEVSPEKVSDAIFVIPPGYKPVTKDDLRKMSQGK